MMMIISRLPAYPDETLADIRERLSELWGLEGYPIGLQLCCGSDEIANYDQAVGQLPSQELRVVKRKLTRVSMLGPKPKAERILPI